MDREDVDVLVADVQQPGLGGLDLLQIVRENFPLVEIIMTSAAPDVDGAVKAIKLGAYHFLTKDADPDVMRGLVRHAGERQDLNATSSRCRTRPATPAGAISSPARARRSRTCSKPCTRSRSCPRRC